MLCFDGMKREVKQSRNPSERASSGAASQDILHEELLCRSIFHEELGASSKSEGTVYQITTFCMRNFVSETFFRGNKQG